MTSTPTSLATPTGGSPVSVDTVGSFVDVEGAADITTAGTFITGGTSESVAESPVIGATGIDTMRQDLAERKQDLALKPESQWKGIISDDGVVLWHLFMIAFLIVTAVNHDDNGEKPRWYKRQNQRRVVSSETTEKSLDVDLGKIAVKIVQAVTGAMTGGASSLIQSLTADSIRFQGKSSKSKKEDTQHHIMMVENQYEISCLFGNTHFLIFESNSVDETPTILRQWTMNQNNDTLSHRTFCSEYLFVFHRDHIHSFNEMLDALHSLYLDEFTETNIFKTMLIPCADSCIWKSTTYCIPTPKGFLGSKKAK